MANRQKPQALRELHGTADRNKHRTNQEQPIAERGIGPATNELNKAEQKIWDEVVGHCYAGVMKSGDRIALETMCRLIHEMRTNFADMTASKLTQLTNMLGRFGLTPSDRTKIIVPKVEKANGFASLHKG